MKEKERMFNWMNEERRNTIPFSFVPFNSRFTLFHSVALKLNGTKEGTELHYFSLLNLYKGLWRGFQFHSLRFLHPTLHSIPFSSPIIKVQLSLLLVPFSSFTSLAFLFLFSFIQLNYKRRKEKRMNLIE